MLPANFYLHLNGTNLELVLSPKQSNPSLLLYQRNKNNPVSLIPPPQSEAYVAKVCKAKRAHFQFTCVQCEASTHFI